MFYGYDWEAGEFLIRKQYSERLFAPEAEVAGPQSVHLDLTGGPDSAADAARLPLRSDIKCPIFDPLGGLQDPAPFRISFYDFVEWDIARAYPFLNLAARETAPRRTWLRAPRAS